jgi:iron complex transport system ATP-binding protein
MPLKITNFSNTILNNISFEVKASQNLIILGSNGVGKTTLAKILAGIIPSNTVSIDGVSPSKTFGLKRVKLLNYIPPKLEIFDTYLSVSDFLALNVFNDKLSVKEVLNTLELTHLAEQSCQTLSSGEAQLLLMASALLHEANYTIFDEPTANLDPQKMQIIFALLKDALPKKSKILITHNLDLAYKLGFDVLFLHKGKIIFHGTSKDFFEAQNLNNIYQGAVIKEHYGIRIKL